MDMDEVYGPVVGAFTQAEFIADGTFVQVPPEAGSAAGIDMPLIITAAARRELVAGDDGGEDVRLHTVLSTVAQAIKQSPANEVCYVVPARDLPSGEAATGEDQLIAISGPGDTGEPVLTLMLSNEM
ncbi:DUF6573 family protein [Streptomyces sp. NPDC006996]|uniref:DUF6573 family protein n=1 Tax=Streptomyces sp. NPDC006996 TaxID=3156908 RepID=UPI0033E4BA97